MCWRLCVSDEFNIYTREAGAGILSVAVEGPSPAKIELVDNPNGYSMVSYVVTKDGRFAISDISYRLLWSCRICRLRGSSSNMQCVRKSK